MKTDHRITYQLARAEHVLRLSLDGALAEHGISLTNWAVLSHIANQPGIAVADIARGAFISQQAISRTLAKLERLGLISRATTGSSSRRKELSVTEAGARVSAECDRLVLSLEHALREQLGPDTDTMLRLIQNSEALFRAFRFDG